LICGASRARRIEDQPLSPEEQPLACLIEAAAAARRHRVAICLVQALKSVNSPAKPTTRERAESDAAEAACWVADTALAKGRLRGPR
jgi:hypothetical protein